MEDNDQLVEGFNAGYVLEKYQPELAQKISQAVQAVEEDFFQGFVAGSEEYVKERNRAKLLEKLRGDISRPTRLDRDIEKDDLELDR